MEFIFFIEILVIAGVVVLQFYYFNDNRRKIRSLEGLYPESGLEVTEVSAPDGASMKLLAVRKSYAPDFKTIVKSTNLYLQKNKGSAADFNILRDISERESDAVQSEIESGIALPLYIGLMGTFLGVIIGLLHLSFGAAIDDNAVQTFLGGVLIGMASSANGLLLTTLGSFMFRKARGLHDRFKNNYYTFLQAELLPSLNSDMASSLTSLKANLSAFNAEFSGNINAFKGTVSGITENLTLQKNFLEALDKIGYNDMATSSLQVFEKLEKSLTHIDKFVHSIEQATTLTNQAKDSFSTIRQIMDDLKGFREGVNRLGDYMKTNDNLIEKQVRYLTAYVDTADKTVESMGRHFDKADDALTSFVSKRVEVLMEDSRRAAVQLEDYFDALKKDNIHAGLIEQIQGLGSEVKLMNEDLKALRTENERQRSQMLELQQMEQESRTRILTELDSVTKELISRENAPVPAVVEKPAYGVSRFKDSLVTAGIVFVMFVAMLLVLQILVNLGFMPAMFIREI
jgi:hypothetical protein